MAPGVESESSPTVSPLIRSTTGTAGSSTAGPALSSALVDGTAGAGSALGPGLIAEDLPEVLPAVLRRLKEGSGDQKD